MRSGETSESNFNSKHQICGSIDSLSTGSKILTDPTDLTDLTKSNGMIA
jgi:hypothetical protein